MSMKLWIQLPTAQKPNVVIYTHNPKNWEVETGKSVQCWLHSESKSVLGYKRLSLTKRKEKKGQLCNSSQLTASQK